MPKETFRDICYVCKCLKRQRLLSYLASYNEWDGNLPSDHRTEMLIVRPRYCLSAYIMVSMLWSTNCVIVGSRVKHFCIFFYCVFHDCIEIELCRSVEDALGRSVYVTRCHASDQNHDGGSSNCRSHPNLTAAGTACRSSRRGSKSSNSVQCSIACFTLPTAA